MVTSTLFALVVALNLAGNTSPAGFPTQYGGFIEIGRSSEDDCTAQARLGNSQLSPHIRGYYCVPVGRFTYHPVKPR